MSTIMMPKCTTLYGTRGFAKLSGPFAAREILKFVEGFRLLGELGYWERAACEPGVAKPLSANKPHVRFEFAS